MKQNKKLLALLLVLVIAFTSLALVACNKDGDKGGDQAKKVVRHFNHHVGKRQWSHGLSSTIFQSRYGI